MLFFDYNSIILKGLPGTELMNLRCRSGVFHLEGRLRKNDSESSSHGIFYLSRELGSLLLRHMLEVTKEL